MNFDTLREKVLLFLNNSRTHLGRTNTKSRQQFVDGVMQLLDGFGQSTRKNCSSGKEDSIKVLKPKSASKALRQTKGVTSMTSSESARADEELGRSPFGSGGEAKDE